MGPEVLAPYLHLPYIRSSSLLVLSNLSKIMRRLAGAAVQNVAGRKGTSPQVTPHKKKKWSPTNERYFQNIVSPAIFGVFRPGEDGTGFANYRVYCWHLVSSFDVGLSSSWDNESLESTTVSTLLMVCSKPELWTQVAAFPRIHVFVGVSIVIFALHV